MLLERVAGMGGTRTGGDPKLLGCILRTEVEGSIVGCCCLPVTDSHPHHHLHHLPLVILSYHHHHHHLLPISKVTSTAHPKVPTIFLITTITIRTTIVTIMVIGVDVEDSLMMEEHMDHGLFAQLQGSATVAGTGSKTLTMMKGRLIRNRPQDQRLQQQQLHVLLLAIPPKWDLLHQGPLPRIKLPSVQHLMKHPHRHLGRGRIQNPSIKPVLLVCGRKI